MKTVNPPIFFRESKTEVLTFSSKPNAATRQALRSSGFKWNGVQWFRNVNATVVVKPLELAALLANPGEPDSRN